MINRLISRVCPTVLLVALCVPRSAVAQWPSRLGAPARDTLQRLVDSARAVGLPSDPVIAKAAEGVLKGADDARIVRAARTLVRELSDARSALPVGTSVATLTAAASAIHAGVTPDAIRQLTESRKGGLAEGNLAVALVTLADLVASRVPRDMATTSIRELLARGAPDAELSALRAAVAQDITAGASPETAITSRTRAIVRSLDSRGVDPRAAPTRVPPSPTAARAPDPL